MSSRVRISTFKCNENYALHLSLNVSKNIDSIAIIRKCKVTNYFLRNFHCPDRWPVALRYLVKGIDIYYKNYVLVV